LPVRREIMRLQDIVIGKYYGHKDHPNYGCAKVIKILPPKTGINTKTYTIVKCEWSLERNDTIGLIKYFKPSNLVEVKDG